MNDIEASRASFTRDFDQVTNECFTELRRSSFFDAIPSDSLRRISEYFRIRSYPQGGFITEEGAKLSSFYVVLFGTTSVHIQDQIVATVVGGECIGEGCFLGNPNILRTASVIADEDVTVAEIDWAGIDALRLDEKLMADMNKALLQALFKKLQGANRRIMDMME